MGRRVFKMDPRSAHSHSSSWFDVVSMRHRSCFCFFYEHSLCFVFMPLVYGRFKMRAFLSLPVYAGVWSSGSRLLSTHRAVIIMPTCLLLL